MIDEENRACMARLGILLHYQTTEWKWKKAKNEQILRPRQRAEKPVEYEGNSATPHSSNVWKGPPRTWKRDSINWRLEEEMKPSKEIDLLSLRLQCKNIS